MKLTVVGCAGSFPNASSAASCYLVEHDGFGLLLDLGNGAVGPLANYRDVDDVDAVAISHFHLDHCADLVPLYVTRRYRPKGVAPKIPVLGPVGIEKRMNEIVGADGGNERMSEVFDFIEYSDRAVEVGPFTLSVTEVCHCIPGYAMRITAGGRTLVYSGDTGPCASLTELARGADLGLFEASTISTDDNPPNLHMSGKDAGFCAEQAGLRRLVLTHFVSWNDTAVVLDEARSEFSGELVEARPGLELTV